MLVMGLVITVFPAVKQVCVKTKDILRPSYILVKIL